MSLRVIQNITAPIYFYIREDVSTPRSLYLQKTRFVGL